MMEIDGLRDESQRYVSDVSFLLVDWDKDIDRLSIGWRGLPTFFGCARLVVHCLLFLWEQRGATFLAALELGAIFHISQPCQAHK